MRGPKRFTGSTDTRSRSPLYLSQSLYLLTRYTKKFRFVNSAQPFIERNVNSTREVCHHYAHNQQFTAVIGDAAAL